jgi:acyl carrier protein
MVDVFDDDDIVAKPELTAKDVPGWDSMAHVRLLLQVEREFGVKFTASEIASFKTVGDLARSIADKTARS